LRNCHGDHVAVTTATATDSSSSNISSFNGGGLKAGFGLKKHHGANKNKK